MNIFWSILVVLGVGFGLAVLLTRYMARTSGYDKALKTAGAKSFQKSVIILSTVLVGLMLAVISLITSMGIASFSPTEKIPIRQTELTATRGTDFLYDKSVETIILYKDGSATDITTLDRKLNISIGQRIKIAENIETAVMEEYISRIPETTYMRYVPFASLVLEEKTFEIRVPPGTIVVRLIKTVVR